MVERVITEATVRAELKPDLRRLADIIGLDAMMRLIEKCGGTELTIAKERFSAANDLVAVVGPAIAEQVARDWGHGTIYLPKCNRALVYWLRLQGLSNEAVARRLRMAIRSVHAATSELPSSQMDLFSPA